MEVRRKEEGGNALFKTFLMLLHHRQSSIAASTTTIEEQELLLSTEGEEKKLKAYGRIMSDENKRSSDAHIKTEIAKVKAYYASADDTNTVHISGAPNRHVSSITIRVLQKILLFAVPIYSLRYKIFAMSLGRSSSCFVDRVHKKLMTFGLDYGVNIHTRINCRGCAAGDSFYSIITDSDQVWASGGLKIVTPSAAVGALGKKGTMYGVAPMALMVVSSGDRLAYLSRDFKVVLLSASKQSGAPLISSRHVRFFALGRPADVFMVGTDSLLYKVARSSETINTPRRVLAFARIPVSRVASGSGFIVVIDQCGQLLTFGRNKFGQLGNGEQQDFFRRIFRIRSLSHHFFTQVAAGEIHSVALTSSGVAYVAGGNGEGQIGLGPGVQNTCVFTPVTLPCRCVGIAAGPFASAFALEDGSVYACGLNRNGRLGITQLVSSTTSVDNIFWPTRIPSIVDGVESYTLDFSGHRSAVVKNTKGSDEQVGSTSSPLGTTTVEEPAPSPPMPHLGGRDQPHEPVISDSSSSSQFHDPIGFPQRKKKALCCC